MPKNQPKHDNNNIRASEGQLACLKAGKKSAEKLQVQKGARSGLDSGVSGVGALAVGRKPANGPIGLNTHP